METTLIWLISQEWTMLVPNIQHSKFQDHICNSYWDTCIDILKLDFYMGHQERLKMAKLCFNDLLLKTYQRQEPEICTLAINYYRYIRDIIQENLRGSCRSHLFNSHGKNQVVTVYKIHCQWFNSNNCVELEGLWIVLSKWWQLYQQQQFHQIARNLCKWHAACCTMPIKQRKNLLNINQNKALQKNSQLCGGQLPHNHLYN